MGVVWAGGDGRELWRQANAAYQRALELAPDDLDVHLRYLDMLYEDCVICSKETAPEHFVATLNRALALAPANPTLLWYEASLREGSTVEADFFARATQQAAQAVRAGTPGASPAPTDLPPAAVQRRPIPTPGVAPGVDMARSAGRWWARLLAVGALVVLALGVARARRRGD